MRQKQRVSDNPIFNMLPRKGFTNGSTFVQIVFWRTTAAFDDWQASHTIVSQPIVTSARTIYQGLGAGPMVLKTGAWFRSALDYQAFLAMSYQPGTLRMDADYTMHRDETRSHAMQTVTMDRGDVYAEFDNVIITSVADQTFDNDGGVRCQVTFERMSTATDARYGISRYR